jgi:hypothetical protein
MKQEPTKAKKRPVKKRPAKKNDASKACLSCEGFSSAGAFYCRHCGQSFEKIQPPEPMIEPVIEPALFIPIESIELKIQQILSRNQRVQQRLSLMPSGIRLVSKP